LGLKRLATAQPASETAELLAGLDSVARLKGGQDLLALADLFNDISALGEAERKLCLQMLKAFADYQHSSRRTRHVR
jgi:hypothetical protein